MLIVRLALVAFLAVLLSVAARGLLRRDAVGEGPPASSTAVDTAKAEKGQSLGSAAVSALAPGSVSKVSVEEVFLRGWVVQGRRFNAILSDGRTLTEGDGLVSSIERNGVRMKSGAWIPLKVLPREIPAGSPAVLPPPAGGSAAAASAASAPVNVPVYRGEQLFDPSPSVGESRAVSMGNPNVTPKPIQRR